MFSKTQKQILAAIPACPLPVTSNSADEIQKAVQDWENAHKEKLLNAGLSMEDVYMFQGNYAFPSPLWSQSMKLFFS